MAQPTHARRPGGATLPVDLDAGRVGLGGPRRRRCDRAVESFWHWWATGGARQAASALAAGDPGAVVPEVTSLVEAMDPGLAWEFGPGRDGARHTLTVTAAGAAELRGIARRWLAGAPEDDPVWAFADLREPVAGRAMVFRGRRLAFDDTMVAAHTGLSMMDVEVHHPGFAALERADRELAAYLLLDAVLGEAVTEKWIRRIRAVAEPFGPDEAEDVVELAGMPELCRRLEADNLDEDGSPAWQILQGKCPDGPVLAMVRTPLVALSAPHFDQHVAVVVPYTDVADCGLPGPRSLPGLRDLEDHLCDRVRGSAECVGAESCDGRRTLHFYADSTTPAAEVLRAAAAGWPQGTVEVTASDDPGWSRVQHLRL